MDSNMIKEKKVFFPRCLNPDFKIILANQEQTLSASDLVTAALRHAYRSQYSYIYQANSKTYSTMNFVIFHTTVWNGPLCDVGL